MELALSPFCWDFMGLSLRHIAKWSDPATLINLYQAFPELQDHFWLKSWFPDYLAPPKVKLDGRRVALSNEFENINIVNFLKFVHFHRHTRDDTFYARKPMTDIFKYFRLQPSPMFVKSFACKFFPPWAPRPFANGFLLSDDTRRLHIFATQEPEFRLRCVAQLTDNVYRLSVAPGGSLVVCLHGKTLSLVYLTSGVEDKGTVTIRHTKLVAKQSSWKESMFVGDRTFLAQTEENPGVLMKVTVPERHDEDPTIEPFCNFQKFRLDGYSFAPPFIRAVYKPAVAGVSEAFLVCGVKRLQYDYRLVFFPASDGYSVPTCFLAVPRGVMGRWVLSKDKKKLFVVTATQLHLDDFLAGTDAPQVKPFAEADAHVHESPAQTTSGHLVVYEVSFSGSWPVVRPRFYLGPRKNLGPNGEDDPMGEWYSGIALTEVWRAPCAINTNFLSVKVDERNVAHCFFVASASSVVVYQRIETENFKCFACSENGTYAVYFPAWFSHWSDIRGNRECTNYTQLNPDTTNLVVLDLHEPPLDALIL
jgi:hypothetical protein